MLVAENLSQVTEVTNLSTPCTNRTLPLSTRFQSKKPKQSHGSLNIKTKI